MRSQRNRQPIRPLPDVHRPLPCYGGAFDHDGRPQSGERLSNPPLLHPGVYHQRSDDHRSRNPVCCIWTGEYSSTIAYISTSNPALVPQQFWKSVWNIMDLVMTAFCGVTLLVIFFSGCDNTSKEEELLDTFLLVVRNLLQFGRLATVMRQYVSFLMSHPL